MTRTPTGRTDEGEGEGPDYPVVLALAGRPCLVVGAGPVAARRARGLLAAGAVVTVVAPAVVPELDQLAGSLAIERRPYRSPEAARYRLVVTATGHPDVDRAVVADAAAAGVPVAGADRGVPGTVRLPAVHRQGPVTLAVSTGGSSPALARWLRDRLAAALPPDVALIAGLLDEARATLLRSGRSADSVDWAAALDTTVVPLVESGRIGEARAALAALCRTGRPGPADRPGPGADAGR